MERKSNVDAFGLGPFWSVFLEGIDPWISVFDGSYWLKWVKIRLWLAHWPWLAWHRGWGGWRRGRGPCESTPFFRRCCTQTPRPGSSLPRYAVSFSARREERYSLVFSCSRGLQNTTPASLLLFLLAPERVVLLSFVLSVFAGLSLSAPLARHVSGLLFSTFFFWNSKLRFHVLKAGGGECGVSNSCLAFLCCTGSCTTVIRYLSLSPPSHKVLGGFFFLAQD